MLSPRGFERDLVTKRREYAAAGLHDYWVVDPDDPITIVAFELVGGELVERRRATGDETLRVERPFPFELVPQDLLRRR